ncbi:peptide-methionine (R)-S-oxide reductase MsrB [Candidatus Pacearchaeota archaeon]|nr:peptide-methionine (R)-S-oxide reductase MsrB [Candidatus Pacearchaeota archaeon]
MAGKKKKLTKLQKEVMEEGGTEKAFTGKYVKHKGEGDFVCAKCGNPLFKSDVKFDSGTGWPSFYDAIPGSVKFKTDFKMIVPRKEVVCAKCGAHLGHVFKDAPQTPTGKRFCINSCALDFKKGRDKKK